MMDIAIARPAGESRAERAVRRHPLAGALALFLVFELVHALLAWDGGRVLETFAGDAAATWRGPIAWSIYAILAVLPVAVLGWWRETGLTRLGRPGAWPLLFLPLLAGLPFVLVGFNLSGDLVIPLIIVGTTLIALNEEVFFRGVLLEMLRPLGWRRAITITAALFGSAHALNLLSGANLPFTVLQVVATTAGGVTLAAIRVRTGSLWPLIVVHALLDAIALSTLTGAGVESPMLMPAVFLWGALNLALWPLGWRLLRGRTEAELTALYDGA
jgi:membrane protease YdiL (CAAX protease family)